MIVSGVRLNKFTNLLILIWVQMYLTNEKVLGSKVIWVSAETSVDQEDGNFKRVPWIINNSWPDTYILCKGKWAGYFSTFNCFPFRQNQPRFSGSVLSALGSSGQESWLLSLIWSGKRIPSPPRLQPIPSTTWTSQTWPSVLQRTPTPPSTMILSKLATGLSQMKTRKYWEELPLRSSSKILTRSMWKICWPLYIWETLTKSFKDSTLYQHLTMMQMASRQKCGIWTEQ